MTLQSPISGYRDPDASLLQAERALVSEWMRSNPLPNRGSSSKPSAPDLRAAGA
jgi:hypothetical protein